MKLTPFLLIIALITACKNPNQEFKNNEASYQIIPQPQELMMKDGRFDLDNEIKISYSEDLANEADFLKEVLSGYTNASISISTGDEGGNIYLGLSDSLSVSEAYTLDVTFDNITVAGADAAGVFYGIQSLQQLVQPKDSSNVGYYVPAVKIDDQPRFAYRGMHLDVARHFFPVEAVKKYIDLIALHKMNKFHWHLTEDQGWRIEINKYPKLAEVAAFRNGTIIGHYPGEGNSNEIYGGFYSHDEIRDVLAYAETKHVEVIPEIELPGHSGAAIAAYPELSCFPEQPTVVPNDLMSIKGKELQAAGTPKVVQESWGVFSDVYCAGKENTFEFLEGVLDEVVELFPSKYIHIGGDECPKEHWKICPQCQNRMKDEGLKDEHELQSYFVQRIEKYLNSKGKQIIGWDEILEGGLAPNATVMSWRGEEGGIEAAKLDHDVIMTPTGYCYFDYYQVDKEDQEDEPLSIGGFLPVEKVYSYNPSPNELASDKHQYILGAQGNLWTEYIPTEDQLTYMVLPRMAALAEGVWSPLENKDYEDFINRASHLRTIYDKMGVNYAKHIFQD
ncbi:beta-N-acetylhexosaminidase [Aegicerativicinus sediminis]|uniref:beta-N-acetylhexosaminidase n=1 Tax=Aegicerativicinus sediminis TaxID=2893202 RepID=UPI001E4F6320|nr:beta-N-acetylhexosaminidase [Aegicerativicinus sediminis]